MPNDDWLGRKDNNHLPANHATRPYSAKDIMRDTVERHQLWIYLMVIPAGMAAVSLVPDITVGWEGLLWPT